MPDAEHAFVWGDSGGGKTTLLREMHAEVDGVSVFCDHAFDGSDESRTDGFKGYEAAGRQRMDSVVGMYDDWGEVRIVYRSAAQSSAQALGECVDWARTVPASVQIIADELDAVMPDDDSTTATNPAKWAYRRGRSAGIKVVGATQTPQGMDYNALRSAKWWACVGAPSGLHEAFLDAHSWMPSEALPVRNYQYLVYDKQGEPRYRGETDPRYS